MSAQKNGLERQFAISPLFDAEIDISGFGLVALHPDADHELRVAVTAAVISHFQGYKSIDYVRKKYLNELDEHIARDAEVRYLVATCIQTYDRFYHSITPRSGERLGIFALDLAFVRSYETVKLLLHISRQGFLLEPALIARSLLEQFAYAVSVWETDQDHVVFNTEPQRVIAALKSIQPSVGKAYGLLSETSHYHPQIHYSFIDWDENGSLVRQRSWMFKIISLSWVFYILYLQYKIFEHCYRGRDNFDIVQELDGTILKSFDKFFTSVPSDVNGFIKELFA